MSHKRLIETKPSLTAKIVCYMRALAYREVGPPVAADQLAELFLSPRIRKQVQDDAARAALMKLPDFQPANYSYLTARTRHLDRIFSEAIDNGFTQVVLLGAGYDSRSYRLTDGAANVQIFEVDAPTTQAAKQKYLDLAKIAVPDFVRFVSINFNRQRLADVLAAAGYDATQPTLFIWEGVTYYISAEAVDSTLAFIRSNAGQGSLVAFDYIYEPLARQQFVYHGAQAAYEAVAEAGEPFVFGIADGAINAFVSERGFSLTEHYTPTQFEQRYLDNRFPQSYGFMVNAVIQLA